MSRLPVQLLDRRVVRGGLAAFVGIVALEHVLRPDLPPAEHFVSEYARGSTQPLQVVAFGAWAFTSQTVAGELPDGVRRTTGGRLHDIGSLLILAGLLVAAVASLRLVEQRRYRLAVLGLGIALLAIVPVLVALGLDAPGIGQRGFIAVGLAWQWLFADARTVP